MEWWNLPGPSSFVNEIAIDIANGCNVIVWLPMHTPDGFRDELRERLSRDIKWESLYLEDMGKNEPLDYLYKEFVHGELPRQSQRSLADLMSLEAFGGNVFWMHGLDSHNWKGWIQFLEIYKQACRNIDHLHRSVFCFEWEGQLLGELPDEDVCLRIRKFDNILNSLDIQLFVKTNLPYEKNNGILRNLKSEIVTVLAQWDAFLAEKLMFMNIENLLNILGFLKEFARELDWGNRNDMNDDIAWTYGVCQRLEEKQIMHSCWCALNNPFEIQRRIWQAQLRVLYPFLEEQRLAE